MEIFPLKILKQLLLSIYLKLTNYIYTFSNKNIHIYKQGTAGDLFHSKNQNKVQLGIFFFFSVKRSK